eukprot:m.48712 g.48712  ORF g.48712 m.48712 type:complete len:218 (+) comp11406_c0_seq2:244-897(+)
MGASQSSRNKYSEEAIFSVQKTGAPSDFSTLGKSTGGREEGLGVAEAAIMATVRRPGKQGPEFAFYWCCGASEMGVHAKGCSEADRVPIQRAALARAGANAQASRVFLAPPVELLSSTHPPPAVFEKLARRGTAGCVSVDGSNVRIYAAAPSLPTPLLGDNTRHEYLAWQGRIEATTSLKPEAADSPRASPAPDPAAATRKALNDAPGFEFWWDLTA